MIDQKRQDEKIDRRFNRLFALIERNMPRWLARTLQFLRRPAARLVRVPLGLLFVAGGLLSFLPVLGIWMLPLGLLLLAVDIHLLRGPLTSLILRARKFWADRRKKKHHKD